MRTTARDIEVTADQKETLRELRIALGERGYVIFDVADEHRRSDFDFLAAERYWPRKFLMVRPTSRGRVSIVGFNSPTHYAGTMKYLKPIRKRLPAKSVWSKKQLYNRDEDSDFWEKYFPPDALEPLGLPGVA